MTKRALAFDDRAKAAMTTRRQAEVLAKRCEEHRGKTCASCSAEAAGQCDETMGAFVCGADICDECEHTMCSNGCNSGGALPPGMGTHCKKGTQVFKGWYENGAEEHNKAAAQAHGLGEAVP